MDKKEKAQYDRAYRRENILRKIIGFNKNKPEDMELWDWLGQKENVTEYIKNLIREDMKR